MKWTEEVYGTESYSLLHPVEMTSETIKLDGFKCCCITKEFTEDIIERSNPYKKRKTNLDDALDKVLLLFYYLLVAIIKLFI